MTQNRVKECCDANGWSRDEFLRQLAIAYWPVSEDTGKRLYDDPANIGSKKTLTALGAMFGKTYLQMLKDVPDGR